VATALIVSPHLDDAVLSIGGAIARWAAAGTRVVVATVNTTAPPLGELPPAMRVWGDYGTRRVEDAAACAVLGAEARWLDRTERAFRRPWLSGWQFFATPPARDGFTALAEIAAALEPLAELDPQTIAVPLGIGNHVDHVETLIAATEWAARRGWRDRLRFYEDFYALAGSLRRRHWVAKQRVWRHSQSPLLRARRLAVIMKTIGAAGSGPSVESYLDPALRDAAWTVERIDIRAHEYAKLAAIACYRSQTAAFGGLSGITRALRVFHAWWGGAEPLWRPR
jgi:LmbE family N-acetylglucosaminyl deacetylase